MLIPHLVNRGSQKYKLHSLGGIEIVPQQCKLVLLQRGDVFHPKNVSVHVHE